jgi:hypothetical protein
MAEAAAAAAVRPITMRGAPDCRAPRESSVDAIGLLDSAVRVHIDTGRQSNASAIR